MLLSKNQLRGSLLGLLAEGLAFLWAIDAVEADTLSSVVVQDFDGVAVEDGDDEVGEVRLEALICETQ